MANAGNILHGIYGNQQFMDHLYRYGEINRDIQVKKQETTSTEMNEKCAMHRVSSVNICLSKIKSTTQDSEEWKTYFNYIRWNQKLIGDEFQFYLPHMEKHRGTILACNQLLNYVMNEFCNFTYDDETIFSEYKHVYDMVSGSRRQPGKVLLQAGKLFVNFINILSSRYYYEEDDIKFADIKTQAAVIIEKLTPAFHHQANTVKIVYEQFINLKEMQDCQHKIQNDSLRNALKLAHARATETLFQSTKRLILEAIRKVDRRLRIGLRTAISVGETIIHPILHPIETAKNVCNSFLHPVDSIRALITWAKENPWKCAAIAIGGLALGAVAFGATAFFVDMLIFDFTKTVVPYFLFGGGCGGVVVPLSVATNRANEMINIAKNDELKLRRKFNSFENDLNAQGENIASQALNEENIDWWSLLDGVHNDGHQVNEAANETDRQIEAMNEEQLRQSASQLSEYLPNIENELINTQRVIEEATEDMSRDEKESLLIHMASEVLKRRMAETSNSGDW